MVNETHRSSTGIGRFKVIAVAPDCGLRPFMARLGSDRAGNVLALAAACLPPILILVGGGIDMSRAYMTQTSLQSACDAGVLAGRRAQAKSGTWSTAEQTKAQRMFNFNYQGSAASASSTTFTPTDAGNGVISGTASTTIPTVVMKMFGTNSFTLTANCSAEFQISNIDVMFILDTTGSMACLPNNTSCNSGSSSKIVGLREAVRQFYYTIAAAVPGGGTTRVRFGFVPYSGTVNMRTLVADGDIPSTFFTASTMYQSKVANFTTPNYIGTNGAPSTVNVTSSQSSSRRCNNWAGADPLVTGGPPPTATVTTEYARVSYDSSTDICTRSETTYTTTYTQSGFKLTDYSYDNIALDTSTIRTLAAVPVATAISSTATVPTSGSYNMLQLGAMTGTSGITVTNATWGGCIEERTTVNARFSNNNAPSGATDHDLTSAPSGDSTRWRPYFSLLEFDRGQRNALNNTSDNYDSTTDYCVPPAMKFTTVDTSARTTVPGWLETYLGTLVARGNTYHDIGMMWGARLANPSGIMSANVNAGGLTSISRNIIMLTDGEMAPNSDVYNAYGLEYIDNRVAPAGQSNSNLVGYHNDRFLAACQTAKSLGYTIWFIGFGQALTSQMTACASSGKAYFASDTAALQNTFRHIASQVADLRLKT